MKTAYASRRRRPCALGTSCVYGGRIRPGDRVIRARQHVYVHQADRDAMEKAIETIRQVHWTALYADLAAALREVGARLTAAFGCLRSFLMPDALPMDDDPDRCWRCDAKPGMEELDGTCWHCHYDLTARAPAGSHTVESPRGNAAPVAYN